MNQLIEEFELNQLCNQMLKQFVEVHFEVLENDRVACYSVKENTHPVWSGGIGSGSFDKVHGLLMASVSSYRLIENEINKDFTCSQGEHIRICDEALRLHGWD